MIVAVVPLKVLTHAKSRLSTQLSPEARRRLAVKLASRTVTTLAQSSVIDRIALVTAEVGLAESLQVVHLPDAGALNPSIQRGMAWASRAGAGALLVVPADLPRLTTSDVIALTELPAPRRSVVIVGTDDGGTGALLLRPPDVLAPRFGPDSFKAHREETTQMGIPIISAAIDGFQHDLDTPEDLEVLTGYVTG